MAKMKSTTGTGGKQRAVKERGGEKLSATIVGKEQMNADKKISGASEKDDTTARTSNTPKREISKDTTKDKCKLAAEQARAAYARAAKAVKTTHRHEVKALRIRQAAHARTFKSCKSNEKRSKSPAKITSTE
ncbi:hypothetical protein PF002_g7460 [Phytophthora fragariae]|uniref:Uncharacterized protein n=3 Tax=Phytophthora fragariae TaxID=53985 RepID=A0A6A4A2E1_9STRA|nr:hypothetical protein PF002_g7460 [Phytophthora fragariae]